MPYGGGTFSLVYSFTTEAAAPPIEIAKLDGQFSDIASGLTNCLLRDGTGLPVAAISWNSQRLTNLANATTGTDGLNRDTGDARYPQLSQNNVFSGQSQELRHASNPIFGLWQTGAAANNGRWAIEALTEQLSFSTVLDNGAIGSRWMLVDRTNGVIDSILITSTIVQINGQTVWHAGNDGAGSGLDSDLLDGQQGSFYQNASNLSSGTIPDARIQASGVTQHQASLSINDTQVVTSSTSAATNITLNSGYRNRFHQQTGAGIITIDNSHGFSAFESLVVMRDTSGAVTFAAGGSQTIKAPGGRLSIPEQNGMATATYLGSNVWALSGT